jgi:hypothetical protein
MKTILQVNTVSTLGTKHSYRLTWSGKEAYGRYLRNKQFTSPYFSMNLLYRNKQ